MKANEFIFKRILLGISQERLSQILEVRLETILLFESGKLPIPKVFELAIEALEKRQPDKTPKITNPELLGLIENAKKAEFTRDIDLLQKILQPISDLLEKVDEEIQPVVLAELFRLYGFYLTFYGRARNLNDYHDRAKDFVTRAVNIFSSENLDQKVAESNITLGFCYWNRGEVKEAEALYELVENDFRENRLSSVYLQLQINRMMLLCWDCRFEDANIIFKDIEPLMPFCKDMRLRIMFHFESGILMHRIEKYNQAIVHFTESISLCKKEENQFLLALNYNNFSLLYLDMKDLVNAHHFCNESLNILKKVNHTGWMAHIFDSKALIYLEENKFKQALAMVNESLHYFNQGEDLKGLISSLWTKIRCLLKLENIEESLNVFVELSRLAQQNVSEEVANRYSAKLSKELYIVQNLPFADEVAAFKKSQVKNALIKTNCKITAAAKRLGLKSHQNLCNILDEQFPELYDELNFSRRSRKKSGGKTRSQEKPVNKSETKTLVLAKYDIKSEKRIERIELPKKIYAFDFDFEFDEQKFKTYYFDKFQMSENFGIDEGAVIASSSIDAITEELIGQFILVVDQDKNIITGRLEYDELFKMYFLTVSNGEPFLIEESHLIKEVVGFCPLVDADQSIIRFSKI